CSWSAHHLSLHSFPTRRSSDLFPARSVGPGTYYGLSNTEDVQFIDQRGDIKIEANIEYRFDIYRFFKGAVFLDAGNIWLWEEDRSEEHTSELQSRENLVCRLLL